MIKSSFKVKIIFPTVIVLIALVVVLNVFLWVRFSALSDDLITEKLSTNSRNLKRYIETSKENAGVAAISMAFHPKVIKAIRERDRDEIIRLFLPAHDLYKVNYYVICDNEGRVLVRTNSLVNFGDTIVSRQGVRDALDGKVSTFFESASFSRVAIRTGTPVYDTDDSLVGIIFAGLRFDTPAVIEELKELLNSEIAVFLRDRRMATTISDEGRSVTDATIGMDIAKSVIQNKEEYSGNLKILDTEYKAFFMPLMNDDEDAFAALFLGIPVEELSDASKKSTRNGVILGLSGLAASVALLFYIISSISKPIIKLSRDMNDIANGNLDIEVAIASDDEVGQLSRSLQKVVNILHRLLVDINIMIYEHEKGNTDYCLDSEAFNGDYKVLADNILDLTDLGMKDQLTGIPNRRSFDNRLNLEWNRAIREKQPLSILMVDVDRFKKYNDAYGHQQGDVALQIIARVLKQSLRRSVDFAARWGGEEFAVLLPATDSNGAALVAEKIRKEIENEPIPCSDAGGGNVTVSIGIGSQIPTRQSMIENLISLADGALYKAKESGRNRVVFCGNGCEEGRFNIL